MDPRLVVKFGKRGKMTAVKSPCVDKCAGCPKQFTPVPPEDGKTFCRAYLKPAARWTGKICPLMYKPEPEKEQKKLNPLKASRRGAKQPSQVAIATGSKKAGKKNKKAERRDSR